MKRKISVLVSALLIPFIIVLPSLFMNSAVDKKESMNQINIESHPGEQCMPIKAQFVEMLCPAPTERNSCTYVRRLLRFSKVYLCTCENLYVKGAVSFVHRQNSE